MIVNYIQRKNIDAAVVNDLLAASASINHFTNNGPVKRLLEELLHKKMKLSHDKTVVCLSNGTTACHALMYMYRKTYKRNMKWVIPAFTFPSPVISSAAKTKIVDINAKTYTVDIDTVDVRQSDGVVITNLFGTCNNIEEWSDYCQKNGKILIFDNASSPMTTYKSKNICEYGDASFGSLHHTKFLGFGEGGFVVVPKSCYDSINSIANFGFKNSQRVHASLSSNFKMSDVSAAYCYMQVNNYDIDRHVKIQRRLIELMSAAGIKVFNVYDKNADYVLGNLPLLFDKSVEPSSFRDLGIEANKYYKPLVKFKQSKSLYARMINLPLNESLTDYQVDLMVKAAKEVKDAK